MCFGLPVGDRLHNVVHIAAAAATSRQPQVIGFQLNQNNKKPSAETSNLKLSLTKKGICRLTAIGAFFGKSVAVAGRFGFGFFHLDQPQVLLYVGLQLARGLFKVLVEVDFGILILKLIELP